MTDERRSDDSRIDQILRTVGDIHDGFRDHERRITQSEKDLIRVQSAQEAADKIAAEVTRTLHSKVDGIKTAVATTNTKIEQHMDQERRDKAVLFTMLATVLLSILGSIGWYMFTHVAGKA